MTLIENAQKIWRRWSVWITATQATLAVMWIALPPAWVPAVPETVRWAIVALLAIAALGAMPIKQKGGS